MTIPAASVNDGAVPSEPAAATPDQPPLAAPPGSSRSRPRSVRVSDIDAMKVALQRVQERCDILEQSMEKTTGQLEASRLSLSGLQALQEVARQEQFPLGRSLQRRLITRVVERLKPPPPSGLNTARDSQSQQETRTKVTLSFDVDTDLRSLDELVQLQALAYAVPGTGRREQSTRMVKFTSAGALLVALGMSAPLRAWCTSRQFTRPRDGSAPARVLLERFEDREGSLWYILKRQADGTVQVASRSTEEYEPVRRSYKYALQRSTVLPDNVDGMPPECPAFLRWRPSTAAGFLNHDGAVACGRLTVSLPCCVVELFAQDVVDLVETL